MSEQEPIGYVVDIDRNCNESIISVALEPGTAIYLASQSPAPIPEQVAQASGIEGLTEARIHEILDATRAEWWDVPQGSTVEFARAIEREVLATQSAKQDARLPDGWIASTYVKGELTSVAFRDADTAWACRAEGVPTAFYVLPRGMSQASVEQATGAEEVTQQAAKAEPVGHVVDIDRNANESIIDVALEPGTAIYLAPTTSTVSASGADGSAA